MKLPTASSFFSLLIACESYLNAHIIVIKENERRKLFFHVFCTDIPGFVYQHIQQGTESG